MKAGKSDAGVLFVYEGFDVATAVITGASSGIGKATAMMLASRGIDLVLVARHESPLQQVACEIDKKYEDVQVRTMRADVGAAGVGGEIIAGSVEWFGGVDILVNNAGFANQVSIGDYGREMLERAFRVNALGPGELINAVWGVMKEGGHGGRIVNVSTLGTKDPFPGFFAYAASKCALDSYARSIANEGEEFGIRGFSVAPGAVETRMLRSMFDEAMIPISATMRPCEVAQVIVECGCGDRDSQNGETIYVEKGVVAALEKEDEAALRGNAG